LIEGEEGRESSNDKIEDLVKTKKEEAKISEDLDVVEI
jgi:hypothetical protein